MTTWSSPYPGFTTFHKVFAIAAAVFVLALGARVQTLAMPVAGWQTASAGSSQVPATMNATSGAYSLLVSSSSDRSSPVSLQDGKVSGKIYVFTSPDTGVYRVRFYLDDPNMTGSARHIEKSAPYDFAGGTASTANAFDTTKVSDGSHTITAAVELSGGGTEVVDATFTVANSAPALVLSPNTLSFAVSEDGTDSKSVTLGTSDETAASYTLSDDATWLTVSPESGASPSTLTVAVDATGLAPGSYNATATASASGYTSAKLAIALTVGSTSAEPYDVLVSSSPDRANPVPLQARTVYGDIYVFTSPETGVKQVRFYLDDPNMTGTPRHVEKSAPYDFAGGTASIANPFKTTSVPDGSHTITAAIDLTAGGTEVVNTTFTVGNSSPVLAFSSNSLAFSISEGGSDAKTINIDSSDRTTASYTLTDDASWLTLTPETGTTPAALTASVDTAGLSPGIYTSCSRK